MLKNVFGTKAFDNRYEDKKLPIKRRKILKNLSLCVYIDVAILRTELIFLLLTIFQFI